jgi:hypothetical protein
VAKEMRSTYIYSVERLVRLFSFAICSVIFIVIANRIMLVLQNTLDESHWLQLNQSLFRVSSLMNGKKDAVREIEVGHRTCFFFHKV